ncbi:MAG: hypothetical protein L0Z62_50265 [Gemmataceae bacterium]|nr:hypothetical protein [Gemmataceae bacterium]
MRASSCTARAAYFSARLSRSSSLSPSSLRTTATLRLAQGLAELIELCLSAEELGQFGGQVGMALEQLLLIGRLSRINGQQIRCDHSAERFR